MTTNLTPNAWYWISDHREGDIFYPVFAADEHHFCMDGKHYKAEEFSGLTIQKAVMPEDN